jgi:hypothetical protein
MLKNITNKKKAVIMFKTTLLNFERKLSMSENDSADLIFEIRLLIFSIIDKFKTCYFKNT